MSFSYNLQSPSTRDHVRLLIPDHDPNATIYQDEEIDTFIFIEGGNTLHSAALALETLASSEVYIQKVQRLDDLHTDGAHVSRELRLRAQILRDRADKTGTVDINTMFDWAEWNVDHFTQREHWLKELQRSGY